MARWRLKAPHYLNVPGIEAEYKEMELGTGRQVRRVYAVPLYLNPDIATDRNYGEDVIVSDGNNPQPRDVIFLGPPTPDMEPMDSDAQKITDREKHKWVHPIEGLEGSYAESMMRSWEAQMADLKAQVAGPSVSLKEFNDLKSVVQDLLAQNAELKKAANIIGDSTKIRRRA